MILVLNPGSSSLKFKLFSKQLEILKEGNFKVGAKGSKNFKVAADLIINQLSYFWPQIDLIGIRIVFAGQKDKPELITDKAIAQIKKCSAIAPLHNPKAIETIKAIRSIDKTIHIYAVYDNSFFATLPEESRLYAIDQKIAKKLGLYRNGFHGISHHQVLNLVDPRRKLKLASIHLGSGCSIAAINKGKVVDTSMGMTPFEGLVMQTRSGDIDAGVVMAIVKKFGINETNILLENKAGLAGLTDSHGSMKDILYSAGYKVTNTDDKKFKKVRNAKLALTIYTNRIKKYIGSYAVLMGGVDAIAFTGEIGYRSAVVRNMIMKNLDFLKIKKVHVVEPNEELEIAKEIAHAKFT